MINIHKRLVQMAHLQIVIRHDNPLQNYVVK